MSHFLPPRWELLFDKSMLKLFAYGVPKIPVLNQFAGQASESV